MTRVVLLVALALALGAAWWSGAYSHATPERVAALVERAGIFGPIAFVALFAAAELVQVPGALFVVAAALLWPVSVALPTAYLGALIASVVVFVVARRLVPEALRERLPERLLRYEARLVTHGLTTVIALRLVLFLAPAAHWLLGASRVSFRDFLLGTAIGIAPGVIALVLLGRQAFDNADVLRPWLLGALALGAVLVVVRRARAARRRVTRASSSS